MSDINEKLKKLKIVIPNPPAPVGNYVAYNIIGRVIYISGQLPIDSNGKLIKGTINNDLDLNKGYEAAKLCMLNALGHLQKATGDLNKVKSCIKLTGYVNSVPEFTEQPKVINGASDLIFLIFEDNGKHSRAAVSANSLPLGVAVEVDAIFEII